MTLDLLVYFKNNFFCHDNDLVWHPSHGSAEDRWQNDYINMYYEMKEKIERKYLKRGKDNQKD